jgi:hypothetical protein
MRSITSGWRAMACLVVMVAAVGCGSSGSEDTVPIRMHRRSSGSTWAAQVKGLQLAHQKQSRSVWTDHVLTDELTGLVVEL